MAFASPPPPKQIQHSTAPHSLHSALHIHSTNQPCSREGSTITCCCCCVFIIGSPQKQISSVPSCLCVVFFLPHSLFPSPDPSVCLFVCLSVFPKVSFFLALKQECDPTRLSSSKSLVCITHSFFTSSSSFIRMCLSVRQTCMRALFATPAGRERGRNRYTEKDTWP